MNLTLRNRYLKGIFALGLAFSLSNIYAPLSAQESPRQDERVLRFEIDEVDHKKLANVSEEKIRHHIEYATYQTDSENKERLSHIKVAKEIVQALQVLMPQMQLIENLSEMQKKLATENYHLVNSDLHSMMQQTNELRALMPELSARLINGLRSIDSLIKENKDPKAITKQISLLYSDLMTMTEYIPLDLLESNLNKMENMLNHKIVPQRKLLTLFNTTIQNLQISNKKISTIMVS